MRQLTQAYIEANADHARSPRFALKIINDHGILWLTSHDDVSPTLGVDDQLFAGVIEQAGGLAQKIEPEKGFSTIGDITIKAADIGITEALRALRVNHNDTIYNNRAELLSGFEGLPVADYTLVFPYYVHQVSNSDVAYTIKLTDTQRLTKNSLFQNMAKTELTETVGLSYVSTLKIRSIDRFQRVAHGPTWTDAPNQTVGYAKLKGNNANGQPVSEYIRYTGIQTSPPALTGVTRGLFGSDLVDAIGNKPAGEGNTELEEVGYLDLPAPKLILALLTGDLYGQAGETLPDHWHAGVSANLIDLASFENIGEDLWNPATDEGKRLEFIDLEKTDAKAFIYQEIARIFNLILVVNQQGELSLRRFTSAPTNAPGQKVIGYESIVSMSDIVRDVKAVRNVFAIQWDWRPDIKEFTRTDTYIDSGSIALNNITSQPYVLELKGVRNSSRAMQDTLSTLAEGIRARFSQAVIKPNATLLLRDVIEAEIADVLTLDLANHPDYGGPDTVLSSYEIQGIKYDFLAGTAKLDFFGSDGEPGEIEFAPDTSITTINHPAPWVDISTVLTGIQDGNTFTVTQNGDLPAGFYYAPAPGPGAVVLRIANGVTVTVNGTVVIDANDIDMVGSARIDGVGRAAAAGTAYYFGGADAAQEGIYSDKGGFLGLDRYYKRKYYSGNRVPARNLKVGNFSGVEVTEAGDLIGLSSNLDLAGNGGAAGESSFIGDDGQAEPAGGAAVKGGAGLCLICDNLFHDPDSTIDLSGTDSNNGNYVYESGHWWWAGNSGFGWPGALVVMLKNTASAAPNLNGLFTAKTGQWSEGQTDYRPLSSGAKRYSTPDGYYRPIQPGARKYANTDYAGAASRVIRIVQSKPATYNPGVDNRGPANLPTLALTPYINEPRTPNGNIVTVTLTATAPIDENYSHAKFSYRLKGQQDWLPIAYGIRNESTSPPLVADGSTYEFSAQSVSSSGQVSNGRAIEEYTTPVISTNANDTNSDDVDITLPRIRRLELINAVDDDENWDTWKGPNAEFRWARLSTTQSGNIVTPAGALDLHLEGYEVSIYRTSDGELLRQELIPENLYTYTLEKNIKDTGGVPTRGLRIEVKAVATTGHASDVSKLVVNNPPPAAVTGIEAIYTLEGVELSYTPPRDLDFVGVKVRGKLYTGSSITLAPSTARSEDLSIVSVDEFGEGATASYTLVNAAPGAAAVSVEATSFTTIKLNIAYPDDFDLIGANVRFKQDGGVYSQAVFINSNDVLIEGLVQGTPYTVEIVTVDTLGVGTATTVTATTKQMTTADLSDAGPWADLTDPADLAFIQANMAADAIESEKIKSLTVAKLTAGQVVVQIDLGTGILLDGTNGYIQTINSGYSVYVGPVTRTGVSANPLVLHDWDDTLATPAGTFWFDLAGNFSLGKGGIVYDVAANLTTYSGALNAATGTFAGELSAATGVFGDKVADQYAEFDGTRLIVQTDNLALNADGSATFGGALAAASGTFTGELVAASGYFGTGGGERVEADVSSDSSLGYFDAGNVLRASFGDTTSRFGVKNLLRINANGFGAVAAYLESDFSTGATMAVQSTGLRAMDVIGQGTHGLRARTTSSSGSGDYGLDVEGDARIRFGILDYNVSPGQLDIGRGFEQLNTPLDQNISVIVPSNTIDGYLKNTFDFYSANHGLNLLDATLSNFGQNTETAYAFDEGTVLGAGTSNIARTQAFSVLQQFTGRLTFDAVNNSSSNTAYIKLVSIVHGNSGTVVTDIMEWSIAAGGSISVDEFLEFKVGLVALGSRMSSAETYEGTNFVMSLYNLNLRTATGTKCITGVYRRG